MNKFTKISAFLAVAVIAPLVFGVSIASAAIYSAPTQKAPTSDSTLTNYPRSTTFTWTSVTGASRYVLEVTCDTCVSKTSKWQGAKTYVTTGTSYTMTLAGDNQYRWRVRAVDSSNNFGPWSGYLYFKYKTGSSSTNSTKIPTVLYPVNGLSYNLSSITYDWTDVSSAVNYNYTIQRWNSSSNVWATVKESSTSGSTSNAALSMSDYTGGQFRFRVQAVFSGSTGDWSAWRYFYDNKDQNSQTSSVTITYPAEGQTVYSSTNHVTYRWNSVAGASKYVIQYTTGLYHQQTLQATVANNYFDFYATYNNDDFGFRVKAINSSGTDITPWSGWRDYHMSDDSDDNGDDTDYDTDAPTIYEPDDGDSYDNSSVYMNWEDLSDAETYDIQVQYESNSKWYSEGSYSTSNNYYTKTFDYDNNYRMRVKAVYPDDSTSDWTDWVDFTVDTNGDNNDDDNSDSDAPYITSIKAYDGGDEGYLDVGDYVQITFSEAIDPDSINDDLKKGGTVTGIDYSDIGGVMISSVGKLTVRGVASFDVGSVENSGHFTSKIALNSTGKILTVTLTSGDDIEIATEDFSDAVQSGGTVYDNDENIMEADSSIDDPTGTFGGEYSDDDNSDSDTPSITSPDDDDELDDGSVAFKWSSADDADSYELKVQYKSGSTWYDKLTYTTSNRTYTKTLSDNDYRVKVRAELSDGDYTDYSDWVYFSVNTDGDNNDNDNEDYDDVAPIVYNPTDSNSYGNKVYVYWQNNDDADYYEVNVQYRSGTTWYNERTQEVDDDNEVYLKFNYDNTYRLRVRSVFPNDDYTAWSDWVEFTVE